MRETLIVSNRGQITLPAAIRKRIGIKEGGTVIIEDRGNELVLKPAAVLEVEMYTDRQIEDWQKADRLSTRERETIRKKVKKGR